MATFNKSEESANVVLAKIKTTESYDKSCSTTIGEFSSSYNTFKKLPIIVMWIFIAIGGLIGIILGILFDSFGTFVLSLIGGAVPGIILFFLVKIVISVPILNLEYTKRTYYATRLVCLEDKLKRLEDNKSNNQE